MDGMGSRTEIQAGPQLHQQAGRQAGREPPPEQPTAAEREAMNGVLLLCLRSGTCLYSQKYVDRFGLPPGVLRGSSQTQGVDSISLASILYALYIQANAAHSADHSSVPGKGGHREPASNQRADGLDLSMEAMSVGDAVLYFAADRASEIMAVASVREGMDQKIGSWLAKRLLALVREKYQEYLQKVIRNPRGFKGMSGLLAGLYQEVPEAYARDILSRLSQWQPQWLYVAHAHNFFQTIAESAQAQPGKSSTSRLKWLQISRSGSLCLPPRASAGAFQYLYSADSLRSSAAGGATEICGSRPVLDAVLEVVQRAQELLVALSPDRPEHLRSMQLPLVPNDAADGTTGDWLAKAAAGHQEAPTSNADAGAGDAPLARLLVIVEGQTLVAMPITVPAGLGSCGVEGKIQALIHGNIAELALFMGFLRQHLPERKVSSSVSQPGPPWGKETLD